ncbi:unnamed protein product, partial [Sphacelaria rigidula]
EDSARDSPSAEPVAAVRHTVPKRGEDHLSASAGCGDSSEPELEIPHPRDHGPHDAEDIERERGNVSTGDVGAGGADADAKGATTTNVYPHVSPITQQASALPENTRKMAVSSVPSPITNADRQMHHPARRVSLPDTTSKIAGAASKRLSLPLLPARTERTGGIGRPSPCLLGVQSGSPLDQPDGIPRESRNAPR